jgi:hypothetical protein
MNFRFSGYHQSYRRYCKVILTEIWEALFNETLPKYVDMIVKDLSSLNENQKDQLTEL